MPVQRFRQGVLILAVAMLMSGLVFAGEPGSKVTGLHVDAAGNIVLDVSGDGFDPLLSIQPEKDGRFRIILKANQVRLAPGVENQATRFGRDLSEKIPAIGPVSFLEETENGKPVLRIELSAWRRLQPQVRGNTGQTITIALNGDRSLPPERLQAIKDENAQAKKAAAAFPIPHQREKEDRLKPLIDVPPEKPAKADPLLVSSKSSTQAPIAPSPAKPMVVFPAQTEKLSSKTSEAKPSILPSNPVPSKLMPMQSTPQPPEPTAPAQPPDVEMEPVTPLRLKVTPSDFKMPPSDSDLMPQKPEMKTPTDKPTTAQVSKPAKSQKQILPQKQAADQATDNDLPRPPHFWKDREPPAASSATSPQRSGTTLFGLLGGGKSGNSQLDTTQSSLPEQTAAVASAPAQDESVRLLLAELLVAPLAENRESAVAGALLNYGRQLSAQRKTEQARALYAAAESLAGNDRDLLFEVGMAYVNVPDPAHARSALTQFLTLVDKASPPAEPTAAAALNTKIAQARAMLRQLGSQPVAESAKPGH